MLSPTEAALIAEACSKSSVLWLRTVESARQHLAWHVWHNDAVHVVQGVHEQTLPLLNGQIEVIVPSKDTGAQLVSFVARTELLTAGSPEWDAAADALSAVRLNTADPQQQRERWASGALVTRIIPLYVASSGAGDDTSVTGAQVPADSLATTVTAYQPWHVRGRASARRALRAARGR